MTKKSIALSLAALLLVLAAGCGKSAKDPNAPELPPANTASSGSSSPSSGSNTSSGTQQQQPPQQSFFAPEPAKQAAAPAKVNLGPLAIPSDAKVGLITVKMLAVNVIKQAPGLPPGYNYVVMNISVTNDGKADYTVNASDHFKMETPEGKPMPLNIQATSQRNPRLQGTLQSGENKVGWLGYMVKAQAGNYKYRFTHPDFGDATWEFPVQK